MIKAASMFSGIGGAELALPEAEWLWCAEIEDFPSAVLEARFGHPNLGDITADDFIARAASYGPLDLLCGGPPCQAFSVAGLRKGMNDPRGMLSIRFLDIAHAIRPRNLLVENVPGWLSHPENAFGCFLGGLVGADDALLPSVRPRGKRGNDHWRWDEKRSELVPSWTSAGMVAGPRARAAWRVLDAQYAGLAQRRERVFLVADFGDGADPVEILFECQSLHGNSAPSRSTGETVAEALSARAEGGGVLGTDFERQGGLQPIAAALDANYGRLQGCSGQDLNHGHSHLVAFGGNNTSGPIEIAPALTSHGGPSGRLDFDSETFLTEPITLTERGREGSTSLEWRQDGTANAILTPNGGRNGLGVGAIAFDTTQVTAAANYSNPKPGDPCHPLVAGMHPPAIAFSCKDHGADATDELSPTLRAMGHAESHANAGGQMAVAIQAGALRENPAIGPDGAGFKEELAYTIEARAEVQAVAWSIMPQNSGKDFKARAVDVAQPIMAGGPVGGNQGGDYIQEAWAVRRLTPTECERLQGYPDGWTLIETGKRRTIDADEAAYLDGQGASVALGNDGRWRTNAAADGPRYKGLGNAWAVKCVRPVAKKLAEALGSKR